MNPNQSRLSCTLPPRVLAAGLSTALALGTLLASATLGACATSKTSTPRTEHLTRVTLGDFVDTDRAQATPDPLPASGETTASAPSPATTDPAISSPVTPPPPPPLAAADADTDGITLAGGDEPGRSPVARPIEIPNPTTPARTDSTPRNGNDARTTRSLQLLDAKIGDVNGKPIFTNSFFAPIEDRLLAEADRLSLNNWRASAGRIIQQRLDGIIADELLRAEAMASLTPNQRVGLQAFLSNFRNTMLSENLGSSQLASRRLEQQQGMTLDEALKQKEIDTLVQLTLIKEINRRVNVSWRDIKLRYERDIDQFSPPPTAVLRVIRAFKDNPDALGQIEQQLRDGVDFATIAAGDLNTYNADADGLHTVLVSGDYASTKFFGPDELNKATQKLSVGQFAGPIELGSSVYWIKLVEMRQESVSLYDAQLKIQRDLTYERREEAKEQYFHKLQERARVSTRDEVLNRLFEIAEERYAPRQ